MIQNDTPRHSRADTVKTTGSMLSHIQQMRTHKDFKALGTESGIKDSLFAVFVKRFFHAKKGKKGLAAEAAQF
jgi:hypothetical protein